MSVTALAEPGRHGFSRLTLGTVQLGLPYGIANQTGQPDYRTSLEIVAAALEGGINSFDTASSYGNGEQVLGQALAELRATDAVRITTKCPPIGAKSTWTAVARLWKSACPSSWTSRWRTTRRT